MGWTRRIVCAASLVLLSGACGPTGRAGGGRALPLDAPVAVHGPARGLATGTVVASNALAYHVAIAPPRLVSVELTTQFELVIRGLPDAKGKTIEPRRVALDTPSYDINALVVSANDRAYVASSAGWVRGYDLVSGEKQFEWRMGAGASALALSDDGSYLLIGTVSGVICLRRLEDGAQLQCLRAHQGRVSALATHGSLLASASWQGELSLWALPSLRLLSETRPRQSVAELAFSPDGKLLAVARNQRVPVRTPALDRAETKTPNIDPMGANRIELWPIKDRALARQTMSSLQGHRSVISSLCWIGQDLLSGSWDRSLQLWNPATKTRTLLLKRFKHIVRDLAATPTGARLAAAGWAANDESPAILWGQLLY